MYGAQRISTIQWYWYQKTKVWFAPNPININDVEKFSFLEKRKILSIFLATNKWKVITLCLLLLGISWYVRNLDNYKVIWFLVKDEKLLKKYKKTWGRFKKNHTKINSELVFSEIKLKVKEKCNNKKITKSFFGKVPDFFGKAWVHLSLSIRSLFYF